MFSSLPLNWYNWNTTSKLNSCWDWEIIIATQRKCQRNVSYSEMRTQTSNRRENHTFFHRKILSVQIFSNDLHPINMAWKGQLTITLQFAYIQSWKRISINFVRKSIQYLDIRIFEVSSILSCVKLIFQLLSYQNTVITSWILTYTSFCVVINGWVTYWFITIMSGLNGPLY